MFAGIEQVLFNLGAKSVTSRECSEHHHVIYGTSFLHLVKQLQQRDFTGKDVEVNLTYRQPKTVVECLTLKYAFFEKETPYVYFTEEQLDTIFARAKSHGSNAIFEKNIANFDRFSKNRVSLSHVFNSLEKLEIFLTSLNDTEHFRTICYIHQQKDFCSIRAISVPVRDSDPEPKDADLDSEIHADINFDIDEERLEEMRNGGMEVPEVSNECEGGACKL